MTAMKTVENLETGKLYIKFINHKLTFHVLPYDTNKSYDDNLDYDSGLGYRQTPIIDIRMMSVIDLMLEHGFKFLYAQGKNTQLISDVVAKTADLKKLIRTLYNANCKDKLEINKISFIKGNDKVIINNNGLISATKDIYPKFTKQFTDYLAQTEL